MPLKSARLAGNARLEQAASTGPSIKRGPPHDDPAAVAAIQRALVDLGYPLPNSFAKGDADGIYGQETFQAVYNFQKREFPDTPGEWDGRCGPRTLGRMDERLGAAPAPEGSMYIPLRVIRTVSVCAIRAPAAEPAAAAKPADRPPPLAAFNKPTFPGFRRG